MPIAVLLDDAPRSADELDGGEVVHFHAAARGVPVLRLDRAPCDADDARYAFAEGAPWRRGPAGWAPMEVLAGTGDPLARNAGILESRALADRTVAIVGLGSGGSLVADALARAGVGGFVLVDRDRVEVANVGRHLCDLSDLGRRKTVAVRDRILRRNPDARVAALDLDVAEDPAVLAAAVAGCDVLVGATDNNLSRRVVNRLAVETSRPAIFGRAYTRACGGDVLRVAPGGPCYECLFGTVDEAAATADAPAYAETPVTVEPGLALDIAPIAEMCARLVLQEIVRGRGSALESLDEDLPGAMFLWANRREGPFAGYAPMRTGFRELAVMRWYGMRADRKPGCPICDEDAFLDHLLQETAP
jgi:molybdopterin/thiamine biosynthesis adenylyltransferase